MEIARVIKSAEQPELQKRDRHNNRDRGGAGIRLTGLTASARMHIVSKDHLKKGVFSTEVKEKTPRRGTQWPSSDNDYIFN